jgi:hypothetical protein
MTYSFLCPLEQMCEVSAFVADVLNSVLLPSGTYSPGKTSPQVLHFIISIGILVIHLLVLHILFYILFYIRCCFYICLTCLKINDVEPKKNKIMISFQVRYYSHFYAHDEHGLPVLFRYELSIHTLYRSPVLS